MATSFDNICETPGQKASDILFTVGARLKIHAPADHVWQIITGFAEYSEWNKDTPKMTFTDSDRPGSSPLREGSDLMMKVRMIDQNNKEYDIPVKILQVVEPARIGSAAFTHYTLAWRGMLMPSWLAVSERVQEVYPIPDEPDRCEVVNWESMSGWGAYGLKYLMGIPGQMKEFNLRYLDDLKTRAEQTFDFVK